MSSGTTLGRRAFLSIPIGVGMAATGVTLARPAFAGSTSTAWSLATTWTTPRGARGRTHCNCSACQTHGANKIFATESDAVATLAHAGCLCVATPQVIATTTYQQLFATAAAADRRDPATQAILTAAAAQPPVNAPTPTPTPTPTPSPSPTSTASGPPTINPVSTSPMSASPRPTSSVAADVTPTAPASSPSPVASLRSLQPVATSGQQQIEPVEAVVASPTATPAAAVPASPTPSASVSPSPAVTASATAAQRTDAAGTAAAPTARPRASVQAASHGSLALWLPLPIVAATAALGSLIWLRNRGAATPVPIDGQRPPGAHRAIPAQPEG